MWIASLDTRNFDFDGYGPTRQDAIDALKEALELHGYQCNLGRGWWGSEDQIEAREVFPYCGYRDRQLLINRR